MKKAIGFVLLTATLSCWAYQDETLKLFDTSRNQSNKVTIVWEQSQDVAAACNRERQVRGLATFNFAAQSCAIVSSSADGDTCKIITAEKTTQAILGHETRHCFQGAFHQW
jgi:hypothetical protein